MTAIAMESYEGLQLRDDEKLYDEGYYEKDVD